MNKYEKEVLQSQLNSEKKTLNELKQVYTRALNDCEKKIRELSSRTDMENIQSVIYQKQYQEAIKGQLEGVLANLQSNSFATVSEYLTKCYQEGYTGVMYDLMNQGIPIISPIDQKAVVKAVQTDSKIKTSLYASMGEDVKRLKNSIRAELSRGIANGSTWNQMAAKMAKSFKNTDFSKAYNNAVRIARTEGHRVQIQSALDAQYEAKKKGADVVKQWDSTLDGKTRDTHRMLDGQIREVDEDFEVGGRKVSAPGMFGDPAEDCNCRCALLQRARWALDEDELNKLQQRAEYFGLDKSKDFEDFKEKYLKASERVREDAQKINSIDDINKLGKSSLEDAYEYHRTNNNMTSTSLADLGDSSSYVIDANYKNLSVESASAFNDTFEKLISEYDTPLTKVRTMTKQEAIFNNAFASTCHNYSVDSAEIIINPMKCKNYDELTKRIIELSDSGYAVKIKKELANQYIATHEFAHSLLNMQDKLKNSTNWVNADYNKIKKARKEVEVVYNKYLKHLEGIQNEIDTLTNSTSINSSDMDTVLDTMDKIGKKQLLYESEQISRYSMENVDEFLAESFTNERIGEKSNPYAKEVYDILNKYFKR